MPWYAALLLFSTGCWASHLASSDALVDAGGVHHIVDAGAPDAGPAPLPLIVAGASLQSCLCHHLCSAAGVEGSLGVSPLMPSAMDRVVRIDTITFTSLDVPVAPFEVTDFGIVGSMPDRFWTEPAGTGASPGLILRADVPVAASGPYPGRYRIDVTGTIDGVPAAGWLEDASAVFAAGCPPP